MSEQHASARRANVAVVIVDHVAARLGTGTRFNRRLVAEPGITCDKVGKAFGPPRSEAGRRTTAQAR